ncbi:MAG: hypothetical protein WCO61_02615 [Alphaproteobacteria bacterium]
MSSQNQSLNTENISEADRIDGLSRLIKEYDNLKTQKADGSNLKRRQMLLSLWGALVLARKDPSQPIDAQPVSPEGESGIEPQASDVDPPPSIDLHDKADDLLASGSVESSDEINRESETQAADEHPSDQSVVAASDHPLVEATSDSAGGIEISQVEAAEDDQDLSHEPQQGHDSHPPILTVLEQSDEVTPNTLMPSLSEEQSKSTQTTHEIRVIDKQVETTITIQDYTEGNSSSSTEIGVTQLPSPIETSLARIFDVDESKEQSHLEIKSVPATPPLADSSVINNSEKLVLVEKDRSHLVRLKLLKTGVLHDLVLPQGTIVSTLAADAEELIASGTAEKLLIQIDPEDE